MRETLKVLLQVRDEGVLAEFAVGGAIAASFYAPAVATEDLDVFAFLKPSAPGALVLTPLYDRLVSLGGRIENEYVVIGTWPVQILPATRRWLRRLLSMRWKDLLKICGFALSMPTICAASRFRPGARKIIFAFTH